MGFRRSLVRIQSPRRRKGRRNLYLRRPLFLFPDARVGNWVGNPGVARRVVRKDAGLRRTAGPYSRPLGLAVETGELLMRPNHPWYWTAKNAWFVEVGDQRHNLGKHRDDLPPPRKR